MDNENKQIRKLRSEQHRDEQQHKDTCKQTNHYTKLIFWSLFLIFTTYGVTAFLGKTTGLPIAYSGDSIDGLRDKTLQKKELLLLYQGVILNDPDYLDSAKMVVRDRADGTRRGADFYLDLTKSDKEQMISKAFEMEHTKVLDWIKEQPLWAEGLSHDYFNMVTVGPKRYRNYTALEWKKKYYDMKKHHAEMAHTEDTEKLDIAENKIEQLTNQNAIDQSKLNLLLAWYWDDPAYLNSVNWVHINEKWEKAYELRLKEAPNVEKALFEQKTKTATKKNLKNNALH